MTTIRARTLNKKFVERAIALMGIGEAFRGFEKKDWDAIGVAVRIVFETERLTSRREIKAGTRGAEVSSWSDSVEAALSSLSWVRELGGMVAAVTYVEALPDTLPALIGRHRRVAQRLLADKLSPAQRLSHLVELGGIEVSLMGRVWALRPVHTQKIERAAARIVKEIARKGALKTPLTETEFNELLREHAVDGRRGRPRASSRTDDNEVRGSGKARPSK